MKIKKMMSVILVIAICISLSTAMSFADSSSTSAKGYGTLYGTLYGTSYTTSVSQNNDNAYLTIKGLVQDINGKNLTTTSQVTSSRGSTNLSGSWNSIPSNAYAIYGTHGVQGGRTYGAAAVYTYTRA